MKCTLHIGTEKTGTTSIQSFLNLNRDTLKNETRTLYTKSLGEQDNRGLSFLGYSPDQEDDYTRHRLLKTDEDRAAHRTSLLSKVHQEIAEHKGYVDRVIFSSEHLQSRLKNEDQILRLKGVLEYLDLDVDSIILYIRNPVETAVSLYSTVLKGGVAGASILPPEHFYMNILCNHQATILRWGNVFGIDKMVVRPYLPDEFYKNDLLEDFIKASDLNGSVSYQRPSNENLSLDILGGEILKRVNAKIPNFLQDRPNPNRGNIVYFFSKHCTSRAGLIPSDELIESYRVAFENSNEWVRSHYFPHLTTLFPPTLIWNSDDVTSTDYDVVADLISDIWLSKQSEIDSLKLAIQALQKTPQ
jgi:hypothetical protein